jgi:hypothetical protein
VARTEDASAAGLVEGGLVGAAGPAAVCRGTSPDANDSGSAAGNCDCPGGVNVPDQCGFLGSRKVACLTVESPNPRLMVPLSDGTVSSPTGCGCAREAPPGKADRDWAQPAIARESIPTAIFHFMSQNISILGEFTPTPGGCGVQSRAAGHSGRFSHARSWRAPPRAAPVDVIGPTRRHHLTGLTRTQKPCGLPCPENTAIGFDGKSVSPGLRSFPGLRRRGDSIESAVTVCGTVVSGFLSPRGKKRGRGAEVSGASPCARAP